MVRIAENVGHAMTYKVLTLDTQKIIYHSNLCSASSDDPNQHQFLAPLILLAALFSLNPVMISNNSMHGLSRQLKTMRISWHTTLNISNSFAPSMMMLPKR